MSENVNDFISARRKDDAVIFVCQDNKEKTLLISSLNQAASQLLKYEEGNLLNKPLTDIVNTKTAESIKDYLEYAEDGQDLYDVLGKVIGFALVDSKGQSIMTKVKPFRTAQYAKHKINYELLIRDVSLHHRLGVFRNENLKGEKYTYHDSLNIVDSRSTILELCIVLNFALKHDINAAIGIIGLNSEHNKINDSEYEINNALKVVIEHFYKNCRSDDFLGHIDKDKVLFILFNCSIQDTPKVIERIRSSIIEQLQQQKLPSISIIYGNTAQKLVAPNNS